MQANTRSELGDFLRSRRARIEPNSAGFAVTGRRRTPGLRREEVAQLAGVSVTWYTWLEQGRDVGVSRQVLYSLARALRLTAAEQRHLLTLAGHALPAEAVNPSSPDPTLIRLVDSLEPRPAYVANPWWDLAAYTPAYSALLGDLSSRPCEERNSLWLAFTDPYVQNLLVDWDVEVRQLLGQLRQHMASRPDDPRGAQLVDALSAASAEFRRILATHQLTAFRPGRKRFRIEGRIVEMDYTKLITPDRYFDLVAFFPLTD